MNLNIENLVRSGVVLVVGLPVALSVGSLTNSTAELVRQNSNTGSDTVQQQLKDDLADPCFRYLVSKADSKLERAAKDAIDEVVGGEVDYGNVCKWAF